MCPSQVGVLCQRHTTKLRKREVSNFGLLPKPRCDGFGISAQRHGALGDDVKALPRRQSRRWSAVGLECGQGAPARPRRLPNAGDTAAVKGGDQHDFDARGALVGAAGRNSYPAGDPVGRFYPGLFVVVDGVADRGGIDGAVARGECVEILSDAVGGHHE